MTPHRRRNFTKATKREALLRSAGICECHRVWQLKRPQGCGVALRSGHVYYEHIEQDALGGDNSLDNCAALTTTCWREKTDRIDLRVIARNNRQRDNAWGTRTLSWRPMPGTKRSGIRKPLNPWSRPVDRRTGRVL